MKKIKILLVTMLFACTANATVMTDLSERDWMVAGDKSLTFDQSTGLEWLDITVTLGNSILDTEAMSLFDEFRWATNFEIEGLFDAVVDVKGSLTTTSPAALSASSTFVSLFGGSGSIAQGVSRASPASYSGANRYGIGLVGYQGNLTFVYDPSQASNWTEESNANHVGSWLVRDAVVDVPEPSTLAIFALGLIGLASRRFKKQS